MGLHASTQPHLLIVDDDPVSLNLAVSIFGQQYQITTAEDGQAALDALSDAIDLVLLDVELPRVHGFEVLRRIRASAEYTRLPVMLVSGLSDSEDIARGLLLGANDYIVKPVDPRLARARLNTQLALKRMMDAQQHALSELQAAQQMKDHFFSIASHDLQNPINTIQMAHFLLRGMIEPNADTQKLLNNIELALDSMQEIVRDYLDTAALQSSAIDLSVAPVEVNQVLWDVAMQHTVAAQKKGILLTVCDSSGTVIADARRLAQALGNLVSNAIKYSPAGSEVLISSDQSEHGVRIAVRDYGPGIPAAERDLLFREFSKTSSRPTAGETSTGLGLWIVKQLIGLQGGVVGADFPDEGGSNFWIELPTAHQPIALKAYAS